MSKVRPTLAMEPSQPQPVRVAAPPQIELRVHGDFVEWLEATGGTLAATTYNSGKLAMLSAPEGRLELQLWRLPRPMGLAYDAGRLAVATHEQIWEWAADAAMPELLRLAAVHRTGRLDVHEAAFDHRGLCFANTRFNCVARPSARAHFRRVWTPWFIADRTARDACHLNGLGVRNGRVAMATAFCVGAEAGGWRSPRRLASGVVIDVRRQAAVVDGLCMPHSPRWDGRRWWLCNSGKGTLATFDARSGAVDKVAVLPGFTRGLCFAVGTGRRGAVAHSQAAHSRCPAGAGTVSTAAIGSVARGPGKRPPDGGGRVRARRAGGVRHRVSARRAAGGARVRGRGRVGNNCGEVWGPACGSRGLTRSGFLP